jgi:hypothetical protein
VRITVHASPEPLDEDEVVAMAAETISRLSLSTPRQDPKAKYLDGGEMFRSWAVPEH